MKDTGYCYCSFLYFIFEGQRGDRDFPSAGSASRCRQQSRPGRTEARRLELRPGLPCGWQSPGRWSHHLMPPSVHTSIKLQGNRAWTWTYVCTSNDTLHQILAILKLLGLSQEICYKSRIQRLLVCICCSYYQLLLGMQRAIWATWSIISPHSRSKEKKVV